MTSLWYLMLITANDLNWDGVDVPASKIVEEQNLSFQYYTLPGRTSTALATEAITF